MIKGFSNNKPNKLITLPRPMIKFIQTLDLKELVGAEIGVLNGENARSILETLDIKNLFLIDPYLDHKEYLEIKGPIFAVLMKRAKLLLEEFNYKITWIRKRSSEAVEDVPEELDFIYIDGNHTYKNSLEDIKNYWPKIKKGGIIGGHDYYNKNEALEVKKAVDEFVEENNLKLNFIREGPLCDWWIVK